jgi:hypothetical protein
LSKAGKISGRKKGDIAMRKLKCVLCLVLFSLAGALSAETPTVHHAARADEYVCPPCGCAHDKEVFHAPGTCPSCGMQLVLKGSPASMPMSYPTARQRVAILIFDGVQIIDYTGPYEVFGQAGFEVVTVAAKPDMIQTSMGMKVMPHYDLAHAPKADVVVVPGGDGVAQAQQDPQVIKWIQDSAKDAQHVLSVCNGAYILARTGLLDGTKSRSLRRRWAITSATRQIYICSTNKAKCAACSGITRKWQR